MLKSIGKRIIYAIPSLFLVILITFMMARILPGDPVTMYAGDNATEERRAQVTEQLGLDDPLPTQFVSYVKGIFTGDWGYAWHTSNNVLDDLAQRFPATLELALWSLFIAVIIGIPLGILAAVYKDSILDHLSRLLTMLGAAFPVFWLGLLLIYFFFYKLGILPAPLGRLGLMDLPPDKITGLYVLDALLEGNPALAGQAVQYLILPAVTLSMGSLAIISRMTRASMLEELSQDYVRTARAKGLSGFAVVTKHALSNAWISILTTIGSQLGILMGSTVVTETIFSWPGIGSYLTQSILVTDYAPIQSVALLTAVIYIVINLLLDILYTVVDPRVSFDS